MKEVKNYEWSSLLDLTGKGQIGRAHVWTPVTATSRMPSSAWKKKKKPQKKKKKKNKNKKIIKKKNMNTNVKAYLNQPIHEEQQNPTNAHQKWNWLNQATRFIITHT